MTVKAAIVKCPKCGKTRLNEIRGEAYGVPTVFLTVCECGELPDIPPYPLV